MCGDPWTDIIAMALITIASPIGFAFLWNNYRTNKLEKEQ